LYRLKMSSELGGRPPVAQGTAFTQRSEWFNAFLASTTQKRVTDKAIVDGLATYAPGVQERLEDADADFDVLYVGAGNGGLELPLTEALLEIRGSRDRFGVYCVDPAVEMEAQFRQNLIAAGRVDPDVIKEYAVAPFEDISYKPPKADLSVASHVWYYIDGWEEADVRKNSLAKLAGALKPDGSGLITLQSNTGDLFNLRTGFEEARGSNISHISGEQIGARLKALGISLVEATIESQTSVINCFTEGRFAPNENGKRLLSFMLRADWDNENEVSKGVQDRIGCQLTDMVQANGAEHMRFIDNALWISHKAV
jgi:SAM-dependent methyltransferase